MEKSIFEKVYKVPFCINNTMKKDGVGLCSYFSRSTKSLNSSFSHNVCSNYEIVTQLMSSCGLSGNRTHTSYFGDTRATITLLAH